MLFPSDLQFLLNQTRPYRGKLWFAVALLLLESVVMLALPWFAGKVMQALLAQNIPTQLLLFWLLVMGVLYAVMKQVLKPAPLVVSVSGELLIPRSRDGHFYVAGMVAGKPVTFLVDTGASMVVVSEKFADAAGMARGQSTTFNTASGILQGRIVPGVTVSVEPASIAGARVGVGPVGADPVKTIEQLRDLL